MGILKFNNKINYIHNKDFKTIIIRVMFPYTEKKEELALNELLCPLLSFTTKNYPTEDSLTMEKQKKYLLRSSIIRESVGDGCCLCYQFLIPDSSCLKDNIFEEQFKLMEEIIYNPNVNNNEFDINEFEREKTNLIHGLDSIDKNMRPYQHHKLINLVDDEGLLSQNIYNNRDLIDKVNTRNLYKHYKNIIKNTPFIFVFGNYDEDEMNRLFNKYIIKSKDKNIIIDCNYDNYLTKYKDKYDYYEEDSNFRDSSLSVVYKIRDFCKDDYKYLIMLKLILTALPTRVLDSKLRDENDLVYGSNCGIYKHYGLFEITTYINKNNKDRVFEKILEIFDDLKDEKYVNELINKILEFKRISMIKQKDLKYSLFNDYIFSYLKIEFNQDDLYKLFLDIKAKDIKEFLDRFVIDTVYFLKEGDHND